MRFSNSTTNLKKIFFALSKKDFHECAPLRDPQHSRNCGAAHPASLIVVEAAWGWPAWAESKSMPGVHDCSSSRSR
ncbi:MAG: hypothetical protein EOO22_07045 [Comamonadaceae bacterium]|nr:MAG: hypothetical protein EOO22_07045 [Comamonadaceae bacterium]